MAEKRNIEELITEAKKFFDTYKREIGQSIREDRKVIVVNFADLAAFSHKLAEELLTSPEEVLHILETALDDLGLIKNARVRFVDIPQTQFSKIGHIRAKHLNKFICIEGIVRQASDVRPQVVNAKFECPTCGTVISVLQIEKKFREPSRCSCGRRGQFRLISKEMVDAQRLVIEESPESLSGGEQPRRISVFLQEDLVEPKMEEKTTPGSRVRVIGILKEVPVPLQTGSISTRFDLALEANNLIPLEETYEEVKISEEDERQIEELAADPKVFEKLSASIAPSIWGYEEIKKALVLQMFGGVRKVNPDGSVKRGDIHILLIGDPGVAKSIGKNEEIMYFSKDNNGKETIENLYKKYGRFPKDLKVLTIDQVSQKPKWEKVGEIIKHLPEKSLIKALTEHGRSIIATRDHSFITLAEDGKIVPIKGEELTKSTYLPLPVEYHHEVFKYFSPGDFNKKSNNNSKVLPEKIILDRDFGFFIGIFLAKGYIKNKKTIEISNNNKEIQKRVVAFSKKIGLDYNLNDKDISIFSKNLSDILMAFCYDQEDLSKIKHRIKVNYSRIKKIPGFAFFSPREFIYGLISGLFSGDGRLIKDKKMLKGFELITISRKLAEDLSDLLFAVGLLNKLKSKKYYYKNSKTDYYSVSIPPYMIKKFVEGIEILGREIKFNKNKPIYSYNTLIPCGRLVYEVVKKLGYNSRKNGNRTLAAEMRIVKKRNKIEKWRLLRLIKEFEGKSRKTIPELEILKKIANSNLIWSKVKDIQVLKKNNEEVYDLSIPSTNTFVANGVGVHNSVTLKFIADMAPKGRYIVGKATSGAGITATVVRDEFLRGWALEAGAMVLANKGIVCIDELEKMDENDRSAMHEAMEQQTVTISKANVQATLHAKTSVLAAGNPKLGRFEPFQTIAQQIDLPPSLINRFDVIFTLRDLPDKFRDESIATHVLTQYQKKEALNLVTRDLFRKYVAYAKQKISPVLSDEAVKEIREFYVKMRNTPVSADAMGNKSIPISARQLEALVRLSEAHAKLRLSKKVTKEDAKVAIDIIKYYLMQVGYDPETKSFDIDRISIGVSTSQRSKVILLRETINKLEERLGKFIPIEELEKELEGKLSKEEIDEAVQKLIASGDVFTPRRGFVQRI